jgi:hypothetical protein
VSDHARATLHAVYYRPDLDESEVSRALTTDWLISPERDALIIRLDENYKAGLRIADDLARLMAYLDEARPA